MRSMSRHLVLHTIAGIFNVFISYLDPSLSRVSNRPLHSEGTLQMNTQASKEQFEVVFSISESYLNYNTRLNYHN